jgi:hypothetical protein
MACVGTEAMMSTIDLTEQLLEASDRASDWSEQRLAGLATAIVSREPGLAVDWDAEAGEDWASVQRGERMVGILHARVPFALLVDGPDFEAVAALARREGMVVVESPGYLAPVFSIDTAMLSSMRPAFDWAADFPPLDVSMHDIYFATV